MPLLNLLNGPPGCGKSTLAQRYVDDHPTALNLDIDRVRAQLGHWTDRLEEAGLAARAIAVAAARVQLLAGRDVVVPQYLGRPTSPSSSPWCRRWKARSTRPIARYSPPRG